MQICGGAAIAPRFILTVAHCVYDTQLWRAGENYVRLGSRLLDQSADSDKYQIKEVLEHDLFTIDTTSPNDDTYDIALVRVDRDIPIENLVRIATKRETPGAQGTLYGFGTLINERTSPDSPILRFVQAKIFGPDDAPTRPKCFEAEPHGMFGDSGGPLVWQEDDEPVVGGLLVASVVRADTMASHDLYVSPVEHIEWIDEIIDSYDD